MTQAPKGPTAATGKELARHFEYQPLMKCGGMPGIKGLAEMMKGRIATMLPRHITPERMCKALIVAAMNQPKLMDCTQESLVLAMMKASQLGLDCSGTLGSGYLVPFKKNQKDARGNWTSRMDCVFIPGYRGLIDLARRGGQIAGISAHAVYAQDTFQIDYGTDEKIVHRPYLGADRREEFIAFYAVATLKDGTKQSELMTLADVNRIRDDTFRRNHVQNPSGPWVDHYAEMARKTVVRRICKYLPLSPELERALEADDEAGRDLAGGGPVIDVDAIEAAGGSKTQALADRLAGGDDKGGDEPIIDQETGEELSPGGTAATAPQPKAAEAPVGDNAPSDAQSVPQEAPGEAAEAPADGDYVDRLPLGEPERPGKRQK